MSSFSLFNTAYSGLAAARAALEVTGQNVANVNTPGYTRQRVDQVSVPGVDRAVLSTTGLNIGQGTKVTGISRLADVLVDARVRDTASSSGYWTSASSALRAVESTLGEPGDTGLSTALSNFWSAWQSMGNHAGDAGSASALLGTARTLTGRLAAGYQAATGQWSAARQGAAGTVATINRTGAQIASLNDQILKVTASGGSSNELIDQRSAALASLSSLAGATTRENANGTIDVLLGGSTFVSAGTSKVVELTGSPAVPFSAAGLQFAGGTSIQVDGGSLAAELTNLAPANGGAGGVYAEAADAYERVAQAAMTSVNALHTTGATPGGTTGLEFFDVTGAGPVALSLTVVPTSVAGIAAGAVGAGGKDASVADAISQLSTAPGSPDAAWSSYVSGIGTLTRAATAQAGIASSAATAATTAQTSQSGVDLDEETANLVVFQHAYQGAARVLTAIDEMLDTLINRTGLVGRA